MSVWTSLVATSGILDRFGELGPAIDDARRDDSKVEEVESLERIRTVLAFMGKRLENADGNLLLLGQLQTCAGVVAAATEQVRAYAQNGDPGHLTNANGAIDSALNAFASLVFPSKATDLSGLRKAAESYRESMVAQVKSYESEVTDAKNDVALLNQRLSELGTQIGAERVRLDDTVAAVAASAAAKQEAVTAKYDALEKELQRRSEEEIAGLTGRLTEAHGTWAREHGEWLTAQGELSQNLRDEYEGKLSALDDHYKGLLKQQQENHEAAYTRLETDYEARARAVLDQMEASLARAKKVMGDIGDHGIVGGFKSAADEARGEVIFWHRVTYCSMFFLIAVGLVTAFHFFEYKLTWITLASRLFLSIATGVLAAYAASQASRYQQRERRNRKLELELRALGPFLEPVEAARREEFRLKIAEAFFGQEDGGVEKPGPATPLQLSKESLDKVLDIAAKAVEKFPGK